jgi:hypothetical protein
VFIYDAKSYEKIKPLSMDLEKGEIVIEQKYLNVEVDFDYYYENGATQCVVGRKLV